MCSSFKVPRSVLLSSIPSVVFLNRMTQHLRDVRCAPSLDFRCLWTRLCVQVQTYCSFFLCVLPLLMDTSITKCVPVSRFQGLFAFQFVRRDCLSTSHDATFARRSMQDFSALLVYVVQGCSGAGQVYSVRLLVCPPFQLFVEDSNACFDARI